MEVFEEAATRVWNTRFRRRDRPTLRFEGAERRGYRSIVLGGIRDPYLIDQIDSFIKGCSEQVKELDGDEGGYELDWKVYGRDAVMGSMEPYRGCDLHEVGVLAQVLAPAQERAHDIAALLEARMIGFAYEGARTRTANVAFPLCPIVVDTGPVYRFSILHVVELSDERELVRLFPTEYLTV